MRRKVLEGIGEGRKFWPGIYAQEKKRDEPDGEVPGECQLIGYLSFSY
jgi:hypothetical protein